MLSSKDKQLIEGLLEFEPVMNMDMSIKDALKSPGAAYRYAKFVINGRFPEAEPMIAQDPEFAYYYACDVIKGPWMGYNEG